MSRVSRCMSPLKIEHIVTCLFAFHLLLSAGVGEMDFINIWHPRSDKYRNRQSRIPALLLSFGRSLGSVQTCFSYMTS